ncbi:MAG: rhodanese-like domain-containing protein [Pseudomonadota bacterium]
MPQMITTSVMDLVAQAKTEIEELDVEQTQAAIENGAMLVDIRDVRELQREGRVPGAFHCPRGMVEFWIDPASPYYKEAFADDRKYVFFCAGGMRSALATKAAQDMGLKPVAHMIGGFGAWRKAGGDIEAPKPRS